MGKEKGKERSGNSGLGGVKRPAPQQEPSVEDPLVTDTRFSDATWDPRFSRVPKKAKGAIEDDRFTSKLKTDRSFREAVTPVDRFGRPRRLSKLDPSLQRLAEDGGDDEIEEKVYEEEEEEVEDDDESDESDFDDFVEDANEELEDIPRGKATKRLAVVGLDWSVTRAVDIMASLGSFCPTGKRIEFVEVHPSKFGLERLAIEAKLGPQVITEEELRVVDEARKKPTVTTMKKRDKGDDLSDGEIDKNGELDDSDEIDEIDETNQEDEEDEEKDHDNQDDKLWKEQTALRRYEEERLKYYYAVVQFEDIKSADAVYEQCDGVEYAQSGRAFDLRFIPVDMKIETTARDRTNNVPDGYQPPNVNLSSLNNSTVKLSWDTDAPDRVILKKRAFGKNELNEADLKAYLASSSDEEENGNKKSTKEEIERKRKLLLENSNSDDDDDDGDNKEDDVDLEVTFEPGMLEKGEEILRRKMEKEERKSETEWEARLRKIRERKSEKRKQRKETLAARDRGEEVDEDEDSSDEEEEEEEGDENMLDENDKNSTFSDPFFSSDRDFEEEKQKSSAKKAEKQKKKKSKKDTEDDNDIDGSDDEETQKRKKAELELLMMEDTVVHKKSGSNRIREALAKADSDDEDDRRGGGKRTRGKRRWQKNNQDNPEDKKKNDVPGSVVDVKDERFQGVFESHLYAIDPTHPKFKQNETTKTIMEEKGKRSRKREKDGRNNRNAGKTNEKVVVGHAGEKNGSEEGKEGSAQTELGQLAARVKARADVKAKNKLSKKKSVGNK